MSSATHKYYSALIRLFESSQQLPSEIVQPGQRPGEHGLDLASLKEASVLIPVTRGGDGRHHELVLTVRSANLRSHAGQISLPGGGREKQDRDHADTALRESEEEIGLQRQHVEILGKLGQLALPSGFCITPVIGVIENDLQFTACPDEVADIFHVPIDIALEADAYHESTYPYRGAERKIYEVFYEDYRIWGATAAILHHLASLIKPHL